jgi:tRNA pseudouridine55 synthase
MPLIASGFLNIDKPLGQTSHDVVAAVRRGLGIKKVGHAGTLDPLATGVLVVCLGSATRLSEYVMASTKRYEARVRLGAVTATYDAEGEPTPVADPSHLTQADVEALLPRFTGTIQQVPPIYSAVKREGRKLYELARAGETIEVEPRTVTIHTLAIADWTPPDFTLVVTCSAGTYIRSLAHDLGQALSVGGYLTGLVRTASGAFTLENAVTLAALFAAEDPNVYVTPARTAVADWPSIHLDAAGLDDVIHGRALAGTAAEAGSLAAAYGPDGAFVAVLRAEGDVWRPQKVFAADA